MIPTSTPSDRSSAACVCRSPCARTRLRMPARRARLRHEHADVARFQRSPVALAEHRAALGVDAVVEPRSRTASHSPTIAAAPGSMPTVREKPPLPHSTRIAPPSRARSFGAEPSASLIARRCGRARPGVRGTPAGVSAHTRPSAPRLPWGSAPRAGISAPGSSSFAWFLSKCRFFRRTKKLESYPLVRHSSKDYLGHTWLNVRNET